MRNDSVPTNPPRPSGSEAAVDERYGVLSHHRRRTVLDVLSETDGALHLDELARRVTRHEADHREGTAGGDLDTVRLTLYHTHLPKLAAANTVAYDQSAGTVEFRCLSGDR